ncbi:unnamed protein product [Rotaria sordida]|uniref:Sodium-dependent glucose transporter 1-like protein n=1 Tax=Rotaria sordida TaxID=392033 RepID=A0A815G5X0_9BILA|nr:unnamed protein product [Rotaria sordida]
MSSKKGVKGIEVYTSQPWELVKTTFLVFTWIILGIHLELVGPTINILARQTQVAYAGISTILITRSAGYMTGNIVGAITQNIVKQYPEGLLSFAFLIAAIAVLATPAIYNLIILSIVFFFQGISQGVSDLGGTSLMLTMWGDNVAAPLNIVHLGYGFGAVFANLLVLPFLGEDITNNLPSNSSKVFIEKDESNILVPYSITAFLCLIIAIGHLIFSIREHRIRREALKNRPIDYVSVSTSAINEIKENKVKNVSPYSPRSCGNGYFAYGLLMSIFWIFYMFFLSGNDQTFGKFFFAFLKTSGFSISTLGALWAMVIYWLSYSVGRLVCAVITVFVPVHKALAGLWICGLILAITWFIYVWIIGLTSTNLLVLGAFTGFVFSPTFPLSFAFINQRLNVNPLLVGLLLCGAAFGAMTFQKIAGVVLDGNPKQFPLLLIACVILAIILFVIALVISSIHQRKLNSNKSSLPTSDNKNLSKKSEEEQQMETLFEHYSIIDHIKSNIKFVYPYFIK